MHNFHKLNIDSNRHTENIKIIKIAVEDANLCGKKYAICAEPKKRAWRHGRAWKMKIRAWKNQDPCFNFYKHIYALLR